MSNELKTQLPNDLLNEYKEHFEQMDQKIIENEEKQSGTKISVPCHPDTLFELTEQQQEYYKYKGDMENKVERMKWKIWLMWNVWARFRNNERIIKIVSEMNEEHRYTDFFFMCNEMVNAIDAFGRIIGITPIAEELFDLPPPQTDKVAVNNEVANHEVAAPPNENIWGEPTEDEKNNPW